MGRVKNGGGKPPAKVEKKKAVKRAPAKKAPKKQLKAEQRLIPEERSPFAQHDTLENPGPNQQGRALEYGNLSSKHIHFCRRYAAHGRLTKASREAGFNENHGTFLIKQEPILRTIAEYRERHKQKFDITAEKVLARLAMIAFGDILDFLDIDQDGTPRVMLDPDATPASMGQIREIEQEVYQEKVGQEDGEPIFEPVKRTKIKTHDPIKACELLGRNLNLWDAENSGDLSPLAKAKLVRQALLQMTKADGDGDA